MRVVARGRFSESRVDALSGDKRCGIILGVAMVCPHNWNHAPWDIREVPNCIWGHPRCSMPPFRVGTRIGYLVANSGDLVLLIDGVEVGRAPCHALAEASMDLWL